LARAHGTDALLSYFSALGRGVSQKLAFRTVFGQSMQEFEVEFEALRRDYGAARNYGQSN
jgi:hypothetical protein